MERIDDIIEKIVSFEWDMFQAVNEGGPRADCQEDRATFEGMRRAQFFAWSGDACASYFDDLAGAVLTGRNLVAEKYIHMMRFTAPAQYGALLKTIQIPGAETARLAREISDALLEQTAALHKEYPHVSGAGRPLRSGQDSGGVTSIETYQLGELLTYSEETLRLLKQHITALEAKGEALARKIMEYTVKHYGYASLEAAEEAAKDTERNYE